MNKWLMIGIGILLTFFVILMITLNNQRRILKTLNERALNTERIANTFYIPAVAGQWGETQLKRLAEISGMLPYCEFIQQNEIKEGRPDMTIMMPNKCVVYVDSKAPMTAYLKSIDEPNNIKWIKENVKSIKNHISILSKREYWKTNSGPNLTVMFIPSEAIWLSAIHQDPSIIEYAANYNIIVSTPMTLIGLLKIIYQGWENSSGNTHVQKTLQSVKEYKNNLKDATLLLETILQSQQKDNNNMQSLLVLLNKLTVGIK